jgi:hypothetical protein
MKNIGKRTDRSKNTRNTQIRRERKKEAKKISEKTHKQASGSTKIEGKGGRQYLTKGKNRQTN